MPEISTEALREQLDNLVKIDKLNLDMELVEQPSIFQLVCEESVAAASLRDRAKAKLEQTQAEVSLYIRQHPTEFGFKLTEDSIAAAIITNPKVVAAVETLLNAKEVADFWGRQEEVFKDRARMLQELSGLHISGYFMGTSSGQSRYEQARAASAETRRRGGTSSTL